MKRLLMLPKRTYLLKDTKDKFHATEGYITTAQLNAESGSEIITSTGVKGTILDAEFVDEFERLARNAQIMISKDISWIIGATGIDKSKTIAEAGSGSGGSAIFLARYAKKVYSYDIREDHAKFAEKNARELGAENVEFIAHDVTQGFPKKKFFVILLDMPQPWDAIAHANDALDVGGFIVTYSPSVTQSQQTVIAAQKIESLQQITTVEIIDRHWDIDEKRCRPAHGALGHTGFLTLFRKIKS